MTSKTYTFILIAVLVIYVIALGSIAIKECNTPLPTQVTTDRDSIKVYLKQLAILKSDTARLGDSTRYWKGKATNSLSDTLKINSDYEKKAISINRLSANFRVMLLAKYLHRQQGK